LVWAAEEGKEFRRTCRLFERPEPQFYTMLPAPEIAYQRHIQIRTRWFEEVERMMRRAK
jgi:hypothetical protein